jgi:phage FluMu protein Com
LSDRVKAKWSLSLTVVCPECKYSFNAIDADDLWYELGIGVLEVETKRSNNLEVVCPECDHEFIARCEE